MDGTGLPEGLLGRAVSGQYDLQSISILSSMQGQDKKEGSIGRRGRLTAQRSTSLSTLKEAAAKSSSGSSSRNPRKVFHEDHTENDASEISMGNGSNHAPIEPLDKVSAGDRSATMASRLRQQGYRALNQAGGYGGGGSRFTFAMKSTRRGGEDWKRLVRPFVAHIVHRSVVQRHFKADFAFKPFTCNAAVLFLDLSNYSKITSILANRGSHALSSVVNAYLSRLLEIVHANYGDVVKFAGDAVLVVWEAIEQEDLELAVLCASKCVIDIQTHAGEHPVPETNLSFKVHCGLTVGLIESEIFEAPTHINMQRLYHSVGGEPIDEIGDLVDMAGPGEVCISAGCLEYLNGRSELYSPVSESGVKGAMILSSMNLDGEVLDRMDDYHERTLVDRLANRTLDVEEDFIHPKVLKYLGHSGLSPTQIAQVRDLTVLFIAMTSHGSSVNWLMEVQQVLDTSRCPIVQIIDDDKGVHVVAALNLYESMPESGSVGLTICRELVEKQVGCAIGMACGSTFCGVTGSSTVACRWDITGPAVVRSARLMQYALSNDLEVALDQSIYQHPMAATRMTILHRSVKLKGTRDQSPVYTLSKMRDNSAFRVLETNHGCVHDEQVREIREVINGWRLRCAVVVTGPPMAGKKIACQRAAGYSDLVPYMHVSGRDSGLLQLARTVVKWYSHVEDADVQSGAAEVLKHLGEQRWSRAHEECIHLINLAVERGFKACFLVDRAQFLDEFSYSLIRESLHGRRHKNPGRTTTQSAARSIDSEIASSDGSFDAEFHDGFICFLCVHVSLYHWPGAQEVVERITRSHRSLQVPVIKIGKATADELATMFRDLYDVEVDKRWLTTNAEASGYSAGYFMKRWATIRSISSMLWNEGKTGYSVSTSKLVLTIPRGMQQQNRALTVHQVSADVAMKFFQVYDILPPLYQTVAKILCIASRSTFYALPRQVAWFVLNDLIAEGVENYVMNIMIQELVGMYVVTMNGAKDEAMRFVNPAMADVVFDVCTPIQIQIISEALISRLEPLSGTHFAVPFVVARLFHNIGQNREMQRQMCLKGYLMFTVQTKDWPEEDRFRWLSSFEGDIQALGFDTFEVLGKDLSLLNVVEGNGIGPQLALLKVYSPPISFGPMAHSMAVIFRNIFQEYKNFHGAPQATMRRHQMATESAARRYLGEMELVEAFLTDHNICSSEEHILKEKELIEYLVKPAVSDGGVLDKATKVLEEFIPDFVDDRLQRLRQLVVKIREWQSSLDVLHKADFVLRRAYEAMQQPGNRKDASQAAIMVLATNNWKPKLVPEYLPLQQYQTVASIRNKVLRRLNDAELILYRHQHGLDDLEAFLVVTALLHPLEAS